MLVLIADCSNRGATLRFFLGGGGRAPLVPQYWGGGTRHFFLLTLYNFKNIGGHVSPPAPLLHGPWIVTVFIIVML